MLTKMNANVLGVKSTKVENTTYSKLFLETEAESTENQRTNGICPSTMNCDGKVIDFFMDQKLPGAFVLNTKVTQGGGGKVGFKVVSVDSASVRGAVPPSGEKK